MFKLQWTRPLPAKRQPSLHEALFVLEKNATNLGTSNKSYSGFLEHKQALQFLSDLSNSEKQKKHLENTTLIESLVNILEPSDKSALNLLKDDEKKEFLVTILMVLDNLAKTKADKTEKSQRGVSVLDKMVANGVIPALEALIDVTKDIEVLEGSKRLLMTLYEKSKGKNLETARIKEFISCATKLVNKINEVKHPKGIYFNLPLINLLYGFIQNQNADVKSLFEDDEFSQKVTTAVIVHLLKAPGVNSKESSADKKSSSLKPVEKLLELSKTPRNCQIILSNDGVKDIVRRYLVPSTKRSERGKAVDVLKNILKADDSKNGIELYEEILREGNVKSLDAFLVKTNTNKKFNLRLRKQQKLLRTQMKTKQKQINQKTLKTQKSNKPQKSLKTQKSQKNIKIVKTQRTEKNEEDVPKRKRSSPNLSELKAAEGVKTIPTLQRHASESSIRMDRKWEV